MKSLYGEEIIILEQIQQQRFRAEQIEVQHFAHLLDDELSNDAYPILQEMQDKMVQLSAAYQELNAALQKMPKTTGSDAVDNLKLSINDIRYKLEYCDLLLNAVKSKQQAQYANNKEFVVSRTIDSAINSDKQVMEDMGPILALAKCEVMYREAIASCDQQAFDIYRKQGREGITQPAKQTTANVAGHLGAINQQGRVAISSLQEQAAAEIHESQAEKQVTTKKVEIKEQSPQVKVKALRRFSRKIDEIRSPTLRGASADKKEKSSSRSDADKNAEQEVKTFMQIVEKFSNEVRREHPAKAITLLQDLNQFLQGEVDKLPQSFVVAKSIYNGMYECKFETHQLNQMVTKEKEELMQDPITQKNPAIEAALERGNIVELERLAGGKIEGAGKEYGDKLRNHIVSIKKYQENSSRLTVWLEYEKLMDGKIRFDSGMRMGIQKLEDQLVVLSDQEMKARNSVINHLDVVKKHEQYGDEIYNKMMSYNKLIAKARKTKENAHMIKERMSVGSEIEKMIAGNADLKGKWREYIQIVHRHDTTIGIHSEMMEQQAIVLDEQFECGFFHPTNTRKDSTLRGNQALVTFNQKSAMLQDTRDELDVVNANRKGKDLSLDEYLDIKGEVQKVSSVRLAEVRTPEVEQQIQERNSSARKYIAQTDNQSLQEFALDQEQSKLKSQNAQSDLSSWNKVLPTLRSDLLEAFQKSPNHGDEKHRKHSFENFLQDFTELVKQKYGDADAFEDNNLLAEFVRIMPPERLHAAVSEACQDESIMQELQRANFDQPWSINKFIDAVRDVWYQQQEQLREQEGIKVDEQQVREHPEGYIDGFISEKIKAHFLSQGDDAQLHLVVTPADQSVVHQLMSVELETTQGILHAQFENGQLPSLSSEVFEQIDQQARQQQTRGRSSTMSALGKLNVSPKALRARIAENAAESGVDKHRVPDASRGRSQTIDVPRAPADASKTDSQGQAESGYERSGPSGMK